MLPFERGANAGDINPTPKSEMPPLGSLFVPTLKVVYNWVYDKSPAGFMAFCGVLARLVHFASMPEP
jgi:hypothetical protein